MLDLSFGCPVNFELEGETCVGITADQGFSSLIVATVIRRTGTSS